MKVSAASPPTFVPVAVSAPVFHRQSSLHQCSANQFIKSDYHRANTHLTDWIPMSKKDDRNAEIEKKHRQSFILWFLFGTFVVCSMIVMLVIDYYYAPGHGQTHQAAQDAADQ